MSTPKQSDEMLQAMFGNDKWQIVRVMSEPDMLSKQDIIFFTDEVEQFIIPDMKEKDGRDLREGKAVDVLGYNEDTARSFKLKLRYQQPFYHLTDTTELIDEMGLSSGQRIGFRFEGWFATLVVKIMNKQEEGD
ncbi:hypothetical protein ACOSQ3_015927 [Xanthoceras sorbifolium]